MTRGDGHVAADPSGHVASGRVQTGTTERNNEKGRSHFSPPQSVPLWAPRRTPHVPCRCSDPSISSRTRGRVHLASPVPLFPWNDSAQGGREKRSKTELLITGRAAFVDLFSLFLRCLKLQSVPRPLPLHGWRHRRKKGVSFPSAPHYSDVFIWVDRLAADEDEVDVEIEGFELRRLENGPVPTQRHFVPDNDQMNSKLTASNCLETVQVSTWTCGGGFFQESASQGTAFTRSSSSAGSSHNARPSMTTFNAAGGGWRWNQKIITTGGTDAMPSPSTPETTEKNKFSQECLHQEVTGFVLERVTGGNTLEHESEKWQPPVVNAAYPSFLNLTVPSSSEYKVLTSSDLIIPSSPEFALPYQVMPPEQVQNEVRAVIVTEQEAQPLNIEKHNLEIQGIDLNRTPQQKPKRKMHRPKVIQEGKPTRTPKPRTPKLVTPKAAKMIEEGSTGKRKYVRKKIVLSSSDASSSMLVDNVVPDGTNRGKSVRRRLNFDSESMGARDACPGAAKAFEHCARLQTLDSCLHSTMQPDLQSQAMIENPGSGMTIDLDGSMNQMPYECVSYSEKPNPNFQPRRAEEMTTNQILNLCGSMPDKFVPQRENLNEISKNNNYIANTTTADRSHKTGKLSDSVGISIMILKGTKRDHNVVQDAPISDYTEFMHTVGGISQLSESHCMSDHDLFLPTRSEKKRTGNK
ncbi:hypothetical protein BHE74_00040112 [Ensete ventricosum]|nr:hypothetical protein BHE74_00040112 [Ensete ventricosum]